MKKWETVQNKKLNIKDQRDLPKLIDVLLKNRGLQTEKEKEEFLQPQLELVTPQSLGIDQKQLEKAIKRVVKAIEEKEEIIVYGDYDVDGICGAAIIWESLYKLGAKVLPYIPHRIDEGYGLSKKGINNLKEKYPKTKLIITVDNGIVATDAVEYAREQKIDVIITDHHVASARLPSAHATVHTTKLCGAGVGWVFAKNIKYQISNIKSDKEDDHLELVALATIADLVPLKGANRTLLKFGLEYLRKTKRIGLLALCREAVIDPTKIGVYEIGHLIAPRLNAMGRLEYAMESLRLLCTTDKKRAESLASILGSTNKERQQLTNEAWLDAKSKINPLAGGQKSKMGKLIFLADENYQQGVIGLVAGKLVEEFYRPAIVLSKGDKLSKASARSIHGLNIIEFIRSSSDLLVDAGGHPMAAGFTVETAKLEMLQKALEEKVELLLADDLLTRSLRIDCELDLEQVTKELYDEVQKLSPFGMGNPEPTFVSRNVEIKDMRILGKDGKHLKFKFKSSTNDGYSGKRENRAHPESDSGHIRLRSVQEPASRQARMTVFDAIAFGMGEMSKELKVGDVVDIVYVIDENTWNGNTKLQLKVKDVKKSD